MLAAFYSPSLSLRRFARDWYSVGHTNLRQPGDMRKTVVGRKERFKGLRCTRGGDV
jgi:hypothetical protein